MIQLGNFPGCWATATAMRATLGGLVDVKVRNSFSPPEAALATLHFSGFVITSHYAKALVVMATGCNIPMLD